MKSLENILKGIRNFIWYSVFFSSFYLFAFGLNRLYQGKYDAAIAYSIAALTCNHFSKEKNRNPENVRNL
jgi:hypothetical protein